MTKRNIKDELLETQIKELRDNGYFIIEVNKEPTIGYYSIIYLDTKED